MSLAEALVSCGALRFGDFTLTSGRKSHYYVDIKRAVTRPDILSLIARLMLPYTAGHSRIAGMELGAVPIAVALSLEASIPYVMVRKEGRRHGTQKSLEGELKAGERVLVVEDVTTTGGSVRKAVEALRGEGAEVDRVICVVDREEGAEAALREVGVEFTPLIRGRDLLDSSKE